MSSVSKILNLVRLYPSIFVKASSIFLMLAGFTGVVLKLLMPVPAFILVLGIGLWGLQDRVADYLRSQEGEVLQEMQSMMEGLETEELGKEVEK